MSPADSPTRRRPEILAPAGDPDAFRAALAAGADAVYLGMARFNARGRAERFRGLDLAACVATAHERGVAVHVTLNTLIHDDELAAALALAAEAHEIGVDAVIVQDPGFARILRAELPDLVLHGSTQMTVHQGDQAAEVVRALGLRRVIVARECSVEEAARIATSIAPLGADTEVFVHGALCFAYSGQCLMSNFAGRRSANRGICAQNCRFDFSASSPSTDRFTPIPMFQARSATQLISMKDLAAFDAIGPLADAGIASLKIEGRLKSAAYVSEIVRLYRGAVDAWAEGRDFAADAAERDARRVFSRGFTNGYLAGDVTASMRGDKRSLEGEPDALVVSADRQRGEIVLAPRAGHRIRPGQGYRYTHDRYR
jgi:putative protease